MLVYLAIISPLLSLEESWGQDLTRKRQMLLKYQGLIDTKAKVLEANKSLKAVLAQTEGQFLSGTNASVASSDLQEILKNLTTAHGVQLTSTKVLPPREVGPYLEVPIQVQISGNIRQLLTILYHLEHHKKLLFVPELEINAPRWMVATAAKDSPPLQINLVVSGVIKKGVTS